MINKLLTLGTSSEHPVLKGTDDSDAVPLKKATTFSKSKGKQRTKSLGRKGADDKNAISDDLPDLKGSKN